MQQINRAIETVSTIENISARDGICEIEEMGEF